LKRKGNWWQEQQKNCAHPDWIKLFSPVRLSVFHIRNFLKKQALTNICQFALQNYGHTNSQTTLPKGGFFSKKT
jgi:lipoate synthase